MQRFTLIISLFICCIWLADAQTKPMIDKSLFKISAENAEFSENGGNKSFTIIADKEWSIKSKPASWASLSKNGNTLQLNVKKNDSSQQRSTTFTITSIGKTITVKIFQSGNSAISEYENAYSSQSKKQNRSKFSISSTNVSFESNGGTTTLSVNSTNNWWVNTTPASWVYLSRNGNLLTLKTEPNKKLEPLTSYFTIKSGNQSIRVNISQSGATPNLNISSTSANFSFEGGLKTFTVTSSYPWEIETKPSYGNISKTENQIVLKYNTNYSTSPKTDYFTIKSGNKKIRVDITQSAAPYLTANGSSKSTTLSFDEYGYRKYIDVSTNMGHYDIWGLPSWCKITDKTSRGFYLSCTNNPSSKSRDDYLEIRTGGQKVRINIYQSYNTKKYWRRRNGGWINMALGVEGGYNIAEGSYFANSVIGLRIGNYRDLFQLEFGVAPGLTDTDFHLPAYASLKISTYSGKFYWKIGGAYNIIRNDELEGMYSIRTGLGSAWKHFEWDWAYVQFNPTPDNDEFKNMDSHSNLLIGMRIAWYITR